MTKTHTKSRSKSRSKSRTTKHSSRRRNHHLPKHNTDERTFHSISEWYHHVFSTIGWMILAKSNGYEDKIKCYKNSIERLHHSIENKIYLTREIDKKNDLKIMLRNLDILKEHVNKDFP